MLAVAEEVFAARGYVATSMDEIAERVGVSKPMLYEYFGSKEKLLAGTIGAARTELRVATEHAVRDARDAQDALRRGVLAFFRFITEHRQSWSLLRNESTLMSGATAGEIEATRRQQTDLMTALMSAYLPDQDATSREASAEIIVGACERLAIWCERHEDVDAEQATEHIMRSVWYGLSGSARGEERGG